MTLVRQDAFHLGGANEHWTLRAQREVRDDLGAGSDSGSVVRSLGGAPEAGRLDCDIPNACVANQTTDVTFTFRRPIDLKGGVVYGIELVLVGSGNGINWRRSSYPKDVIDPYRGGKVWVAMPGPSPEAPIWMPNDGIDLAFRVEGCRR